MFPPSPLPLLQAISVHEIKDEQSMFKIHKHMMEVDLQETYAEIATLQQKMVSNAKNLPEEKRHISWPIGEEAMGLWQGVSIRVEDGRRRLSLRPFQGWQPTGHRGVGPGGPRGARSSYHGTAGTRKLERGGCQK
jgi:hypothetical protein